jgi:hypothetical protein
MACLLLAMPPLIPARTPLSSLAAPFLPSMAAFYPVHVCPTLTLGGSGSEFSGCAFGTDCADCGLRCITAPPPSSPAPPQPPRPPPHPPAAPYGSRGTLWAITSGTRCAEDLPFGPRPPPTGECASPSSCPHVCSDCVPWETEAWLQDFWVDGDAASPTLTLEWQFLSGPKTLARRFTDAVTQGERVRWTAIDHTAGTTEVIEGTWFWSWGAGRGRLASHGGVVWPSAPTASFSMDDGCWAAGTLVDGDDATYSNIRWGHCNLASSDVCDGVTNLCCKVCARARGR